MKSSLRTVLSGLAIAVTFIAIPALADMMNSRAALSTVGKMQSKTSTGTGALDVTYDSTAKTQ
eukprot:gene15309-15453_t